MKDELPPQRAGIRQIAEALNISIGSVDRALHGRPGVSPITRERVLRMAARLNYTPNIAARNLKLNKHLRIGAFLPEQIASFFDPLRAGILSAARLAAGANLEVSFHSYPHLGQGDIHALRQNDWLSYDGVILAPGNPAELSECMRQSEESQTKIVFVATDAPRLPRLSSIAVESSISGGLAAELLGQLLPAKSTVIAFTGDLRIHDHADKLRGFAAALAVHAPHLALLPAIESHESPTAAHRAASRLLSQHPDLGGIYINTANSLPILRALEESRKLGKIKIITTDLFPELVPYIESSAVFATLNQRPFTQGKMAFEILSRFLIDGIMPQSTVRLTPHIVLRSNLSLMMDSLAASTPEQTVARRDLTSSTR